MIDIAFSDSACGGLKMAQHRGEGNYIRGCTNILVSKQDGSEPTSAELEEAQKAAEEHDRLEWEKAVPMGGNPDDVFGFNLILSIGDISKDDFANKRKQTIQRLWSIYPSDPSAGTFDVTSELLTTLDTIVNVQRMGKIFESGIAISQMNYVDYTGSWLNSDHLKNI